MSFLARLALRCPPKWKIARAVSEPWHDPEVIDLLWSDASGRVLIGVIKSAGRNWVGVINGNTFTPLNARWALTTTQGLTDFGTW